MEGNLPWNLVFIGVFIAVVVEVLGLPVLPVAIGVYLPFHLSAGIMLGGVVRWFVEKKQFADEKGKSDAVQAGILYASGLVAGEGLIGILLAILAVLGVSADISGIISLGNIGGLVAYGILLFTLFSFAVKGAKKK